MLLLASLAIFIIWESFKREKPTLAPRISAPGQTAIEQGLLIGAGVFAVTGVLVLLETDYKIATGRQAFIWNSLFDTLGKPGVAAFFWITALAMLFVRHMRRKARRNTG
ncbi:MAG: hypothetical protein Q8R72_17395 [Hylemonella sp.]|nr:hypothetical protein [Hylemonella sp.]